MKKYLMSLISGHFNLFISKAVIKRAGDDINKRISITVAGRKAIYACLYQIKLKPQKTIANVNAMYVLTPPFNFIF
jgi:hypothetical protein